MRAKIVRDPAAVQRGASGCLVRVFFRTGMIASRCLLVHSNLDLKLTSFLKGQGQRKALAVLGLLFEVEQHHVVTHGREFDFTTGRNLHTLYLLHFHQAIGMQVLMQPGFAGMR